MTALDSSPEMVAAARERGIDAEQADVVDWTPAPDTDVVITNAVLQWVPTHPQLLPRWLAALPAGAWFALQVPGNFGAPSHALVRELLDQPRWRGAVDRARRTTRCPSPAGYAELLADAGAEVDVWETTYLHRLTGPDPVLEWISGTALRPVRDALPTTDYAAVPRRARAPAARRLPAPPGRQHLVPVPPHLRGRARAGPVAGAGRARARVGS